jgi:hypothetical protein
MPFVLRHPRFSARRVVIAFAACAALCGAVGCPPSDGDSRSDADETRNACVPDVNEQAPDTLQETCSSEGDVIDSCGAVVDDCGVNEVCFVARFAFQEAGVRAASCATPGEVGARCPSEESDYPPCAEGLVCTPTNEFDVSTCAAP